MLDMYRSEQRSNPFFRWLAGWLLLSIVGVGLLGGADRSARAAPQEQVGTGIVISEVAWAGTQASSDDDWIELYNPDPAEVNISNWELIYNTFSITFPTPTKPCFDC
jgi:hypothetical protein